MRIAAGAHIDADHVVRQITKTAVVVPHQTPVGVQPRATAADPLHAQALQRGLQGHTARLKWNVTSHPVGHTVAANGRNLWAEQSEGEVFGALLQPARKRVQVRGPGANQ